MALIHIPLQQVDERECCLINGKVAEARGIEYKCDAHGGGDAGRGLGQETVSLNSQRGYRRSRWAMF
jgi:hypothetical protein